MQIFLFSFTCDQSSLYVTNDNKSLSVNGITFNASAIECKEFAYDLKEIMGEATMQIPFAQAGFLQGCTTTSLEGPVHITVNEYDTINQSNTIAFTGFVNAFKVSKASLELQCLSTVEQCRDNGARVVLTRHCNHRLYDSLCTMREEDYLYVGEITGIEVDRTTVHVGGIDQTGGYFTYGYIKWAGIYRHIVNDSYNGTTRQLDLMHAAPLSWAVGMTITVAAGCDKMMGTCSTKFNNLTHYCGFPFAPYESIRYTGLRQSEVKKGKK